MNKYKSLLFAGVVGGMLLTTSCQDTFKDLNQDPSAVTVASPSQLLTQAIYEWNACPYMLWFNQAPKFFIASQLAVPSGGMNQDAFTGGASRQGFQSINVLGYKYAMEKELAAMSEEDAAKYKNTQAALDVLITYLGIYDTDDCGDMPFTESAQARYGGTYTPKYDRMQDLYDLWLNNLDNCIKAFTTNTNQESPSHNDLVYDGSWAKWAKLANSLKLKIAARLIHKDFARAKAIAQEVTSASCGVLDGLDDDMVFNKASENITTGKDSKLDKGDIAYNTTNTTVSYNGQAPTQQMCNFLIDNDDPRVRFFYTKNSWNSEIVAWFLENGRKDDIPSYIMDNVETQTVNGKETFKAWKGKGEPWVRYYGLPTEYGVNNSTDRAYKEYFNYTDYQKEIPGNKTYRPYSRFSEYMLQGRLDFTLPTRPAEEDGTIKVIQSTDDRPWYGMYMTTAEVNFYLAEFATYGAISGDANAYFQKAIRYSVEAYDKLAGLNKIPYYGNTYSYDPNEKVIDLQDGEIDKMLAHPAYQLTGDKDADLEKIFLQMEIHFTYQPKDMFVTARRSGVPEFNSTLYPRIDYASEGYPATSIARRSRLENIVDTDLMKDILKKAYEDQGFTAGANDGTTLNSERVWQDQGAPQWGEGPNVK